MKPIRIGTRASRLAVVQAEMVARAIESYAPGVCTRLVPMTTTGDRILHKTLDKIGGKGLFVKELDLALLEERVDITVHSCKDLPMELDERLPLVAVSRREDPRDVLVLPAGAQAAEPDPEKPVGCSSARRRIQLSGLYPGMRVEPVRGNVLTRLEKLDGGAFSALALAAAGLNRLGLQNRISRVFSITEMIPAAGQGVLAVQARAGEDTAYLGGLHSPQAQSCILAERAFVRALDGGCSKPCAAHACFTEDGRISLRGMYVSDDERVVRHARIECGPQQAAQQAAALAERMKQDAEG